MLGSWYYSFAGIIKTIIDVTKISKAGSERSLPAKFSIYNKV